MLSASRSVARAAVDARATGGTLATGGTRRVRGNGEQRVAIGALALATSTPIGRAQPLATDLAIELDRHGWLNLRRIG